MTKIKEEISNPHKNEKDDRNKKQKERKEVIGGLVVVELITNSGVVSVDY